MNLPGGLNFVFTYLAIAYIEHNKHFLLSKSASSDQD